MKKELSLIRKIINLILWIILIGFVLLIAFIYFYVKLFPTQLVNHTEKLVNHTEKLVNHTEKLANHYEKYKNQILELKDFVAKNNTKNIKFQIEFEDNYSKFWFRIESKKDEPYPFNQNKNKDEFLKILGWNDEILNLLKEKLKKIDCISYEDHFYSKNSITIGFYRTFLDMYFFKIYDENTSKNEILEKTDDCIEKYYKDNVVFEFGQSAITSGCGFE